MVQESRLEPCGIIKFLYDNNSKRGSVICQVSLKEKPLDVCNFVHSYGPRTNELNRGNTVRCKTENGVISRVLLSSYVANSDNSWFVVNLRTEVLS